MKRKVVRKSNSKNVDFEAILLRFHKKLLRPEFDTIHNFIKKSEKFQDETQKNFDYIFKQIEDLRQEYLIANQQMKRLQKADEVFQGELTAFGFKLQSIEQRLETLEAQVGIK